MASITMKLVMVSLLAATIHIACGAEQKADETKKDEAHKGAEAGEEKPAEAKGGSPTKEDEERLKKTAKAIWKYFNDEGAFTKAKMAVSASIKEKCGAKEIEFKDVRLKLSNDKKGTFGVKGQMIILNQPKKATFYCKVDGIAKPVKFETSEFQLQITCGVPKQAKEANIAINTITKAVEVSTINPAGAFGKGITSKDAEPMLIKLNMDFGEKIKQAILKIPEKDRC